MPKVIRDVKFPDCCGARVLHSFGGHGSRVGHKRYEAIPLDVFERRMKEIIEKRIEDGDRTFLTLILNPRQEKLYGATLRKLGFECVKKGSHIECDVRRGEYTLHLYVYTAYDVD